MSVVWITVNLAELLVFSLLWRLLPAFRAVPLGWRLLGASATPLGITGVNFILRFWHPTAYHYPNLFRFASEAQRILAVVKRNGTTGTFVIIAFAPQRSAGQEVIKRRFPNSKPHPAPRYRWFHHRLMSTALSGRKAGISKHKRFG